MIIVIFFLHTNSVVIINKISHKFSLNFVFKITSILNIKQLNLLIIKLNAYNLFYFLILHKLKYFS